MSGQQFTLRGVAMVLDDHGYGEMADWVRREDDTHKLFASLYEHYRDSLKVVTERLHQYEPPPDIHAGRCNYRSPAESDG